MSGTISIEGRIVKNLGKNSPTFQGFDPVNQRRFRVENGNRGLRLIIPCGKDGDPEIVHLSLNSPEYSSRTINSLKIKATD